jgi:peptide-methionine (R)-S-oxide reductase
MSSACPPARGDGATRRSFLVRGIGATLSFAVTAKLMPAMGAAAGPAAAPAAPAASADLVGIEQFSPAGKSLGMSSVPKIVKSDEQWRRELSEASYQVTRHAGTERPFSGAYDHNHADGIYHCICCDTALYDSRTKFDSGTGWPSFWQPISSHNINHSSDLSLMMEREAISCRRCDAHLGHVFDDGPQPTGLRYCMNSVALNFIARA